MLQVIKAEEVRDGEPRIWIETPQPVMHTESRRDRGCQPCGFAIVDRPVPTPAVDPLATVRAALDAMSTHATGPWPAEIVVQVLNAAPAIAELCAEVERLQCDKAALVKHIDYNPSLRIRELEATRAKLAEAKRLGMEACALVHSAIDNAPDPTSNDPGDQSAIAAGHSVADRIAAALEAL